MSLPWVKNFDLFKKPLSTDKKWPSKSKLDAEAQRIPLDIPAKCSKTVRNVIKKCWKKDPRDRYTFEEIVTKLTTRYSK